MFAGLNVALGLGSSPQHLPAEMAIVALLEDAADDAAGLFLNHFLSMYLKSGQRVVLISLVQLQNHYNLALRRLGANFQQAHTDGRALFVDGLSALFEPKASSAKADVVLCEQQPDSSVSQLAGRLADFAAAGDSPVLFAVDGLSEALSAGLTPAAADGLLRRLRGLVEASEGRHSLVVTLHDPQDRWPQGAEASAVRALCNEWVYWCDLIIRLEGLATGSSRDVHGTVKISRITTGKPSASTVAMQYKAHDSGVDLFAVGTAAGHV